MGAISLDSFPKQVGPRLESNKVMIKELHSSHLTCRVREKRGSQGVPDCLIFHLLITKLNSY